VTEQTTFAPRSLLLPAVLQVEGQAPTFGTVSSLTNQGLAFDFQVPSLARFSVGRQARLDFDVQGRHHSCKGMIVHIQDRRVLLSLREVPASVLTALQFAYRDRTSHLATRLSTLQMQQACHAQFMDSMKAVVDDFYRLLHDQAMASLVQKDDPHDQAGLRRLQHALDPLRLQLIRQLTLAYPMYPEHQPVHDLALSSSQEDAVNMDRVDDWIRCTTVAQLAIEPVKPLFDHFNQHYGERLNGERKPVDHPYQPDAVLNVLADLIDPLRLDANGRAFCYELMARAFQQHAAALYQDLLRIVADTPFESVPPPGQTTSLEEWLRKSVTGGASGNAPPDTAAMARIGELASLLEHLTENLDEFSQRLPGTISPLSEAAVPAGTLVASLLARDRIFSRFLPATGLTEGELLPPYPAVPQTGGPSAAAFGQALGGLSDLDHAALEGLYTLMRQPPPIEPGPEKLGQASQVRTLMLQAQGLLVEYTLNGLTYQTHPDHPAWTLINALDALHLGTDDHGQFLDPTLHHAVSLSMQWLLGQDNVDTALEQVNQFLKKIYAQLRTERQIRRAQRLEELGTLVSGPTPIRSGWCVVKRDDSAIPYEMLGQRDHSWILLNRSASELLEIPAERFLSDLDSGLIEETHSFDAPFLERTADATLTASLKAVHAYTSLDPASGCLKRSALMDELERRLAHPVTEPLTFCALVEIPTMRPGLSSLPGDELAVMQKRTGEILLDMLESGEHCGRLSDVSFLLVFSPQDPEQLTSRLGRLKAELEALHPEWKMVGAVVPLIGDEAEPSPSNLLRRANLACAPQRPQAGFDLSWLSNVPPASNQIDPLPFSALFLRCQKIASCDEDALSHYEILLGINEDLRPPHTTQSFVVMAEQTGRSHDLDTWVLRSVFEWMERNAAELAGLSGLSVNLSGNSLIHTDHVDAMVNLLAAYPQHTKKLIIEVTETAAIGNLDVAVRALRRLRKLGCRVALDDFGSGYSSYGYLRNLPLDYLKIDGTYIRNILTDKTDQALTASMVDVAHALGLKVIAEYVDSEATYAWLKELGVDYVQGYWVHEPQRLDTLRLH